MPRAPRNKPSQAAGAAEPEAKQPDGSDFARGWCFTWNNYQNTQDYDRKLRDAFPADFVIYGKEVGDSGTPHLQGFIYAKNKIRFSTLKNRFDAVCAGVHIEKARALKAAIAYCKKGNGQPSAPVDADVVQWGNEPGQGARNDLEMVAGAIADGMGRHEVAQNFGTMVIKYHRGLEALRDTLRVPYTGEREVIWCWGPSGVGKSVFAKQYMQQKHGDSVFTKQVPTQWWDQYDHEEGVIIDELRRFPAGTGYIDFVDLLSLTGPAPRLLQVKGGTRPYNARTVIITAPKKPDEMYAEEAKNESLLQLTRRITRCIEFKPAAGHRVRQMEEMEVEGFNGDANAPQYRLLRQARLGEAVVRGGNLLEVLGASQAAPIVVDDEEDEQPGAPAARAPSPPPSPVVRPPVFPISRSDYVRPRFVIPRADSRPGSPPLLPANQEELFGSVLAQMAAQERDFVPATPEPDAPRQRRLRHLAQVDSDDEMDLWV